jgi:transcriptional regulator with XRE-family HTH domain
MTEKTIHIGRKISRLRELRGMKQESLAAELGISQQAISRIEQSEQVEDEALERIAKVLGVTPEAIKLFSEEAIFNNIQHNADTATGNTIVNYQFQFNPIEKIVELYDEKVTLLERLLASEREKVELLKEKK